MLDLLLYVLHLDDLSSNIMLNFFNVLWVIYTKISDYFKALQNDVDFGNSVC